MKTRSDMKTGFKYLMPIVFLALAVVGGFRSYSPVPFADMLNGHHAFYADILDGQFSAWWAQHNEHRIVLTRLLFWVDHKLFDGTAAFLIVVNYILMTAIVITYSIILKDKGLSNLPFTTSLLLCWLFLWTQNENLTWGFQSQFFLAQLLPLLAFYFLHKSKASPSSTLFFYLALGMGVLSLGTMANGVITLPLLTLMAIAISLPKQRIIVLCVFSIAGVFLYFSGYASPKHHGSLLNAVQDHPVTLISYVLTYLGNPFYHTLGKGKAGIIISQVLGAILIVSCGLMAIKTWRHRQTRTLDVSMLFFIAYIGGTALATAGGRAIFGVEQALAERYSTPILMLWASFATVLLPCQLQSLRLRHYAELVFSILFILMLGYQISALRSQRDKLNDREVGALALELQIPDQTQIHHVFPSVDAALHISKQLSERDIGIFGIETYHDLAHMVGKPYQDRSPSTSTTCIGFIDVVSPISEDPRYIKVQGWAYEPDHNPKETKRWSFLNEHGNAVGFAISGMKRPDVAKSVSPNALYTGYKGYILSTSLPKTLTLVSPDNRCRFNASLPE